MGQNFILYDGIIHSYPNRLYRNSGHLQRKKEREPIKKANAATFPSMIKSWKELETGEVYRVIFSPTHMILSILQLEILKCLWCNISGYFPVSITKLSIPFPSTYYVDLSESTLLVKSKTQEITRNTPLLWRSAMFGSKSLIAHDSGPVPLVQVP